MPILYRVSTGYFVDDNRESHITYGLEAINEGGATLFSFSDVYIHEKDAYRLVESCNREQVELVHIMEIIQDAVAESVEVTRSYCIPVNQFDNKQRG